MTSDFVGRRYRIALNHGGDTQQLNNIDRPRRLSPQPSFCEENEDKNAGVKELTLRPSWQPSAVEDCSMRLSKTTRLNWRAAAAGCWLLAACFWPARAADITYYNTRHEVERKR